MVKALLFDLTGTLQEFDWEKQWKLLIPIVEKELKLKIERESFKAKYQQAYEYYRLGMFKSDAGFFGLLFMQLGFNASKPQISRIARKHLQIRSRFTKLPKDYRKTLKELRKSFKLVVSSNAVSAWCYYDFKKIFGFDFAKDFDAVFFSQEHSFLKESGELFKLALKKFRLKPSEAAFVGDDYTDDMLLAKAFGLKAVFLNKKREPKGKADFAIKQLNDLPKAKEKLKSL